MQNISYPSADDCSGNIEILHNYQRTQTSSQRSCNMSRLIGAVLLIWISAQGCLAVELIWTLKNSQDLHESRIIRLQGDPANWIPRLENETLDAAVERVVEIEGSEETAFGSVQVEDATGKLLWFDDSAPLTGQIMKQTLHRLFPPTQVTSRCSKGNNLIALDWISHNVYWLDRSLGQLALVTYQGTSGHATPIITDLDTPTALAIAPQEGWLFWALAGATGKMIQKAALDGSRVETLLREVHTVNLLAVDSAERTLFWVDEVYGHLKRSDFSGNNVTIVSNHIDFSSYPNSAMAIYKQWVFLGYSHGATLVIVDKVTGKRVAREALAALDTPGWRTYGMAVWALDLQPVSQGGCGTDNGGCEHICVNAPDTAGGVTCLCDNGHQLGADGLSCTPEFAAENFLLFAESHSKEIYQMALSSETVNMVEIDLHSMPWGVAYHSESGTVYWTDTLKKFISRISFGTTRHDILKLYSDSRPVDLAIDAVNEKLYYIDSGRHEIGCCNLNGTNNQVVLNLTQEEVPSAVVLDTAQSFMYWSDTGLTPKIERLSLAGWNRTVVVHTDLESPSGLALDTSDQVLYWCDSGKKRLEKLTILSGRRIVLLEDANSHFFRLALDKDFLYITDWTSRSVRRLRRGVLRPVLDVIGPAFFGQINGIAFIAPLMKPEESTSSSMASSQPVPSSSPGTTTNVPTVTSLVTSAEAPSPVTSAEAPSPVTSVEERSPNEGGSLANDNPGLDSTTVVIIAVVIAGVIFLTLIITVGVVLVRRRRKNRQPLPGDPDRPAFGNPLYIRDNDPPPQHVRGGLNQYMPDRYQPLGDEYMTPTSLVVYDDIRRDIGDDADVDSCGVSIQDDASVYLHNLPNGNAPPAIPPRLIDLPLPR